MENIWLTDNIPDPAHVRLIQDSDDYMVLNWAPQPAEVPSRQPRWMLKIPYVGAIWKGYRLRCQLAVFEELGDVQKTDHFRYPIRWHSGPLDTAWNETEQCANKVMLWFFGDLYSEYVGVSQRRYLIFLRMWWAFLRFAIGATSLLAAIINHWPNWPRIESYFVLLINDPRQLWDKLWRRVSGRRV